jgi:transcriptional regulator with XRE-family HTH domain
VNIIQLQRSRRGLSQRDLAALTNISQPTISAVERMDPSRVSPRIRIAIARGLGIAPSEFCGQCP